MRQGVLHREHITCWNSHNKLSRLPDDVFMNLVDLEELDVSHNQLKVLPPSVTSLSALEVLNASHNALREVPLNWAWCVRRFRLQFEADPRFDLLLVCAVRATSLRQLNLSANKLTTVRRVVTPRSVLLSARHALLRLGLQAMSFEGAHALVGVNLVDNHITATPAAGMSR